MKPILYFCAAALSLAACQPSNEFTIEGTMAEPFSGKMYLTYVKDRLTTIDSLILDSARTFQFKGTIEHPELYRIITSPRKYDASVIVEPQSSYQVSLQGYSDNPVEATEGGQEQKLLDEYRQSLDTFRQTEQELSDAFRSVDPKKDAARMDSLQKAMSANFQAREQATIDFILQHARTFTAAYLVGDLLLYTYPDLQAIYEKIDTVNYAYNHNYRRFKEKYDEARSRWLQGSPAPDFTTHDLNGKEVKLSDFRGQYVLLDFWASWCRPCRERAKQLKAIYDQLQARGISVCGLSMDEKRDQWEAATKEDGIVWTNTGDVKPFKENTIAADYKVTALPTLFLINPEGIVEMQNPGIEDLLKLPVLAK